MTRPRPVGWRRRGNDPSLPGLYPSCPAAREDLPARSGGVRGGGAEGTSRGPLSSEVLRSPSLWPFSLFLLLAFSPPCLFISPLGRLRKRSLAGDSPGGRAPGTPPPPSRLPLGLLPPPQLCKATAPVFRGVLRASEQMAFVRGCSSLSCENDEVRVNRTA